MQDIGIKIAIFLAVAIAALTSIPLLAQEASAQQSTAAGVKSDASASASSVAGAAAAPHAVGYGDEAASHAWEMSSITGELDGQLDSKTAKPGDRVVLKTIEKVQTSDGTIIPKGSRMIGHVTQVQPYDKEHGAALLGIAFDHVEMKNGQNLAMYMLIRGVSPSASAMAMNSMNGGGMMDPSMQGGAPMGGGMMGGGAPMGGERGGGDPLGGGGPVGGIGGTLNRAGGVTGDVAGGAMARTGKTASSMGNGAASGLGTTENATVETAGHGDPNLDAGAHAAAAARLVPRATRFPGVLLSGNSTASGLLSAARGNIDLVGGTQMQLGIVAKN